jgi:hypothetical protein
LDPKYIEGFVEGCLERMEEDKPEDEALFVDLWEDEGERETVLMVLQDECEVLPGRPEDYFPSQSREHLFRSLTKTQASHPTN